ncbi:hypothetical protein [Roseovarius sp.]|jgi:hypothetical protein|uniref:hypothetical protein n=1 Tax=Roseovarius sp. TaxID=1486281 RepID=UPI002621EF26|nr:hypothetical protein [Roseovarius sp.]MDM8166454.1 hypothetical protein [Roseovarius sp.]
MTRLALITAVTLSLTPPALAQDIEAEPEEPGTERSLMEEGARMFLEGILREMEPALRDLEGMAGEIEPALRDFAQEMGPAFADLLGKVDDLSNYEMPEMLPNGDIIIRRKEPLEPEMPGEPETPLEPELDIEPGEEIEI